MVNVCDEYSGPVEQYTRHNIKQCRCPTVDMTAPALDDLIKAVEFITQQLAVCSCPSQYPPRVFVHCKNGMSRSAAVVLCYLASTGTMSPIAALHTIKRVRPEVSTSLFDYPSVKRYMQTFPYVRTDQLEQEAGAECHKEEMERRHTWMYDYIKTILKP